MISCVLHSVGRAGFEPARSITQTDFKSVASTVPPPSVRRSRELGKPVNVGPHPFKAAGAEVVGEQRTAEASLPGLRCGEVPRLLFGNLVQCLVVWWISLSVSHMCKAYRNPKLYAYIVAQNVEIVQMAWPSCVWDQA